MSDNPWLMRVEKGLSAHFNQADGPSRPGVVWSIGLKHGEALYTVMVKTLFQDDATAATRADSDYQAQTAMQYLNDQLQQGWHPDVEREHTIYLGNPVPVAAPKRPWWKVW